MELTVTVRLRIEPIDEASHTENEMTTAATEAVSEALNYAMNRGFNHPLSDTTSIAVNSVEVA